MNFSTTGYNTFNDNYVIAASQMVSQCAVTIVNVSTSSEDVTVNFSVTMTGGVAPSSSGYSSVYNGSNPGAPGAFSGATWTLGAQGSATDSVVVTWSETLVGNTNYGTQRLDCAGSIQVTDHTATSPGFVAASGLMVTYTESAPGIQTSGTSGMTSGTYVGTPGQTDFVIGEGRPF